MANSGRWWTQMTASRFAYGAATDREPAVPVTAVPVTAVPAEGTRWRGPQHLDGWGDGPVPPPRPLEWTGPADWGRPRDRQPDWDRERSGELPAFGRPPQRRGRSGLRWAGGGVMLVGLAAMVSGAGRVAVLGARSEGPRPRPPPTPPPPPPAGPPP